MKPKTLLLLVGMFLILLTLTWMKKGLKPPVPTVEEGMDLIQEPVHLNSVDACRVTLGEKEISLAREEDRWIVKNQYGAYADEPKLTSLFEKLDELTGELRSDKKELLQDYGLTDEEALHIQLQRDEKLLAHLVIGTKKAGGENNFIRRGDANAVYVVDANLLAEFGFWQDVSEAQFDLERWIDKRIVHLEPDQVKAMEVYQGETQILGLNLNTGQEQPQWQFSRNLPFPLDENKVEHYLQSLLITRAQGIIMAEENSGDETSSWKARFHLEGGQTIEIFRGKKDEAGRNYYVKTSDKKYAFLVPLGTMDNLHKNDGDFFKDNPLGIEAEKISAVEIEQSEGPRTLQLVKTLRPKIPLKEQAQEGEEQGSPDQSGEAREQDSPEAQPGENEGEPEVPAEGTQGPEIEVTWQSPLGETFPQNEIGQFFQQLQQITLKMVMPRQSSIENFLKLKITQDEEPRLYTFTQKVQLDSNLECHYLEFGEDTQGYCVPARDVSNLLNAISTLTAKTSVSDDKVSSKKEKGKKKSHSQKPRGAHD